MNLGDLWTNSALLAAHPQTRLRDRGRRPGSDWLDEIFLDHWIGQQPRGQLGHLLGRRRLGQLQLEPLALPDRRNLTEAEPTARARDRIALWIVDFRLQHHVDDDFRHNGSVRELTCRPFMRCVVSAAWLARQAAE